MATLSSSGSSNGTFDLSNWPCAWEGLGKESGEAVDPIIIEPFTMVRSDKPIPVHQPRLAPVPTESDGEDETEEDSASPEVWYMEVVIEQHDETPKSRSREGGGALVVIGLARVGAADSTGDLPSELVVLRDEGVVRQLGRLPGSFPCTVGYSSDGLIANGDEFSPRPASDVSEGDMLSCDDCRASSPGIPEQTFTTRGSAFGKLDTVGLAVSLSEHGGGDNVTFVCNGTVVGLKRLDLGGSSQVVYPVIACGACRVRVLTNFGAHRFGWEGHRRNRAPVMIVNEADEDLPPTNPELSWTSSHDSLQQGRRVSPNNNNNNNTGPASTVTEAATSLPSISDFLRDPMHVVADTAKRLTGQQQQSGEGAVTGAAVVGNRDHRQSEDDLSMALALSISDGGGDAAAAAVASDDSEAPQLSRQSSLSRYTSAEVHDLTKEAREVTHILRDHMSRSTTDSGESEQFMRTLCPQGVEERLRSAIEYMTQEGGDDDDDGQEEGGSGGGGGGPRERLNSAGMLASSEWRDLAEANNFDPKLLHEALDAHSSLHHHMTRLRESPRLTALSENIHHPEPLGELDLTSSRSPSELVSDLVQSANQGSVEARFETTQLLSRMAMNPTQCRDIIEVKGLQTVLQAFQHAQMQNQTDLELESALALARIVIGVSKVTLLLNDSRVLLTAFHLLLLKASEEYTSELEGEHSFHETPNEIYRTTALALYHFARKLLDWVMDSADDMEVPSPLDSTDHVLPSAALARMDTDFEISHVIANLVSLCTQIAQVGQEQQREQDKKGGKGGSSGLAVDGQRACLVDSFTLQIIANAFSTLAQFAGSEPFLHHGESLKILVEWIGADGSSHDSPTRMSLVNDATSTLARLVVPSRGSESIYMSGYADAQLIQLGLIDALLKLLSNREDQMPLQVLQNATATVQTLCRQQFTKTKILKADGVQVLVSVLWRAVLELPGQELIVASVLEALLSLSSQTANDDRCMRRLNDSEVGTLTVMVDGGVLPALARIITGGFSFKGKMLICAMRLLGRIAQVYSLRPSFFDATVKQPAVQPMVTAALAVLDLANQVSFPGLNTADPKYASFEDMALLSARVLAFLCETPEPWPRMLVEHFAAETFLQLCPISEDVLLEATRGLSLLARYTLPPTAEHSSVVESRRRDHVKVLDKFVEILETPPPSKAAALEVYLRLQTNAIKGIAVLAEHKPLRRIIVEKALAQMVNLANTQTCCDARETKVASLSSALRVSAENAITALGFDGSQDLEYYKNEIELLTLFFNLENELEEQVEHRHALAEVLASLWSDSQDLHQFESVGDLRMLQNRPSGLAAPLYHHQAHHMEYRRSTDGVLTQQSSECDGPPLSTAPEPLSPRMQHSASEDLTFTPPPPSRPAAAPRSQQSSGSGWMFPFSPFGCASPAQHQQASAGTFFTSPGSLMTTPPGIGGGGNSSGNNNNNNNSGGAGGRYSTSMDEYIQSPAANSRKSSLSASHQFQYSVVASPLSESPRLSPAASDPSSYLPPMSSESPWAEYVDARQLDPTVLSAFLDKFWPSPLQQALVAPMLAREDPPALPRVTYSGGLMMPQRQYFTFNRYFLVLRRLLSKQRVASSIQLGSADDAEGLRDVNELDESSQWALCFDNSAFEGESTETLVKALERLPSIRSLCFRRTQEDTSNLSSTSSSTPLAYLIKTLPLSVQHVTYDNVLSRDALQILGVSLMSRKDQSSYLPTSNSIMLSGLAVRNHSQLRPDDFDVLFKSLSEIRVTDKSIRFSLQWLDLSGNKLTDKGVAKALMAVRCCSSLKAMDLSNNRVSSGSDTVDALVGARRGVLFTDECCLETLLLHQNGLPNRALVKLLQALTDHEACCWARKPHASTGGQPPPRVRTGGLALRELGLDRNQFHPHQTLHDALRSFLKCNRSVRKLSLRHNKLSDACAKDVLFGLMENQWHVLHLLHFEGNKFDKTTSKELRTNRMKLRERVVGAVGSSTDTVEQAVERSSAGHGPLLHSQSWMDPSSRPSSRRVSSRIHATLDEVSDAEADGLSAEDMRHKRANSDPVLVQSSPSTDEDLRLSVGSTQLHGESSTSSLDSKKLPRSLFAVLFSAPLAWRDRYGRLNPVEMLDFDRERDMLQQTFREVSPQVHLHFNFATTEKLRSMVTLGCVALHFSGHGHASCLTFEDETGGLQVVTPETLQKLCNAGALPMLRFVFVSACHSRLSGEAFVAAGVPHVVCVKKEAELLDSAALDFTRAFYLALLMGNTVQDSFNIGTEAVAASPRIQRGRGEEEGGKFILLPKPKGDDDKRHQVPIFGPNGEPIDANVGHSRARRAALEGLQRQVRMSAIYAELLPEKPDDFLGREVEMYRILDHVLVRRLVILWGKDGCGKSSVTAALCQYMNERNLFAHGILYLRLRTPRSLTDVLVMLEEAIERQASCVASHGGDPEYHDLSKREHTTVGYSSPLEYLEAQQEWIIRALHGRRTLIVIDQSEMIQTHSSGHMFNLPAFLSHLFQRLANVKVLLTSSAEECPQPESFGVVGTIVRLDPLTLRNAVRLFCRLSPQLRTERERTSFMNKVLTREDQFGLFLTSRDLAPQSRKILDYLGGGLPGRIVSIVSQTTAVEDLLDIARRSDEDHVHAMALSAGLYSHRMPAEEEPASLLVPEPLQDDTDESEDDDDVPH